MTVLHQELFCCSHLVGITWPSQFQTASRSSHTAKTKNIWLEYQVKGKLTCTSLTQQWVFLFSCVLILSISLFQLWSVRISKSNDRRSASGTPHRLWSTHTYGKDLNEDKAIVMRTFGLFLRTIIYIEDKDVNKKQWNTDLSHSFVSYVPVLPSAKTKAPLGTPHRPDTWKHTTFILSSSIVLSHQKLWQASILPVPLPTTADGNCWSYSVDILILLRVRVHYPPRVSRAFRSQTKIC